MGILRALESRASIESPSTPLTSTNLLARLGGEPSKSGVSVDEFKSLQLSAVWACNNVLSQTIGTTPLHVYERLQRGKARAPEHPLYDLWHSQPNPEIDSRIFLQTLQGHLGTWGNAYVEIELDRSRRPVGFWPLRPDRTRPVRLNGRKALVVTLDSGEERPLSMDRALHIPGWGFDGIMGYSPIGKARQAIGLGLATEEHGARFFGDGARFSGVLQHPGTLSKAAHDRLLSQLDAEHSGLTRSQRLKILEEGMTYEKVSIPPEDAQFLETRKFQVEEIARFYRMPLHKIQSMDRATFSNIEHQAIEFVTDTILPWLVCWERALNAQLLTAEERRRFFFEFLVDGLLRGDAKTRHEVYAIGRQWGYFSADDVRALENMNPLPDGMGEIYLIPMNMIPAELAADSPALERHLRARQIAARVSGSRVVAEEIETEGRVIEERPALAASPVEERQRRSLDARYRHQLAMVRLFEQAAGRFVRKEVRAALRMLRAALEGEGGIEEFVRELERFYETFPEDVRRELLPLLIALGEFVADEIRGEIDDADFLLDVEALAQEHAGRYAAHHVGSSMGQIRRLIEGAAAGENVGDLVAARIEEWGEKRAGKIGLQEAVAASGFFALAIYGAAGITRLVWRNMGTSCPLCAQLNGRTAEISGGGGFLEKGAVVDPQDEQTTPLKVKRLLRHPPLHNGCDCVLGSA